MKRSRIVWKAVFLSMLTGVMMAAMVASAFAAAPSIASFTPNNGAVGTAVTINGSNFDPDPQKDTVKFNGTTATVTSATTTKLVATVPNGATTGPVSVTTAAGAATSSTPFTVITSITFFGGVNNSANTPVPGALIELVGNPSVFATSAADGSFALTGLPVATTFSLKISKTGYAPAFTDQIRTTSNIVAASYYALFTQAELAGWGVTTGKGAIRSRVVDNANPGPGYLAGAVVTATSALHPAVPYEVVYFDGSHLAGTATFANGVYLVRNVDDGDTVTVTASKPGWNFAPRTFVAHADAVSEARIKGTSVAPGEFPIAATSGQEWVTGGAFDGINFLIGIMGDDADPLSITAQLVSGNGTLLGNRISVGELGDNVQVAFDGGNYLLAWDSYGHPSPEIIVGQLVSKTGALVGTPFTINAGAGYQWFTSFHNLIFDGTNYFVVWERLYNPDDRSSADVYGQFVTRTGSLLGAPMAISTAPHGQVSPNLALDGTNILVTWLDGRNQSACYADETGTHCPESDIYGQFVTKSSTGAAGTLAGGNFAISQSSLPKGDAPFAVAFDGTNYLITFQELNALPDACPEGGCQVKAFGQFISRAGQAAGPRFTISNTPGNHVFPMAAFDGSNYLVTWEDGFGSRNVTTKGRYMSPAGAFTSPEFTLFATTSNGMMPYAAGVGGFYGGKYFLVANWGTPGADPMDFDSFTNTDAYGAFIGRNSIPAANIPAIMANGVKGSITLPQGIPVSVTVGLAPGVQAGQNADWWIAADTPFGWYSYAYPTNSWNSGINLCAQAPLFTLPSFNAYTDSLPVGDYTFYFGVDLMPNGVLDNSSLTFDSVQVHVTP